MRKARALTMLVAALSIGCAAPDRPAAAQSEVVTGQQPAEPAQPIVTVNPSPSAVLPDETTAGSMEKPAPAGNPEKVPVHAKPEPGKPASVAAPINKKPNLPPVATSTSEPPMTSLALATLEQRLKDTNAIGLFTKLALKNQVDDLLTQLRARHEGSNKTPLAQLRQAYDQLLAKLHELLKNGDPPLAAAIMNSREAIWLVLADPVRFAKL